jgi:hypothetical protein
VCGSGCIDPRIFDLGTSWRWVISFTTLPLYHRERVPGTNWIGGWVGPISGLDDVEKRKLLSLPGLELRSLLLSSPLGSRYTDCAISAPLIYIIELLVQWDYSISWIGNRYYTQTSTVVMPLPFVHCSIVFLLATKAGIVDFYLFEATSLISMMTRNRWNVHCAFQQTGAFVRCSWYNVMLTVFLSHEWLQSRFIHVSQFSGSCR